MGPGRRRATPLAHARTALGHRPDVQGLRGVAVLAVVAAHLLGYPRGGFAGVDVFFVISGYVITAALAREIGRSGTVSIRGFLVRRVRRLLPAALSVVAVTALVSWLVYAPAKSAEIARDALGAVVGVANWRFAQTGTDYFAIGSTSPLQHFWSLAVEEQFYLLWPWLVLLLLVVRRPPRRVVVGVVAVLAAASFGWALYQGRVDPTVAYFSTLTRWWEVGAGALVALLAAPLARVFRRRAVAEGARVAGLLGIALAFVTADGPSYPAPGALLPTIATALLIAAGLGGTSTGIAAAILTNRPLRVIGDLSYSIYLWHFPVVIIGHAVLRDASPAREALLLLVIAVLATIGYVAVERPLRSAGPRPTSTPPRIAPIRRRRGPAPRWRGPAAALAGTALAAAASVALVLVAPTASAPLVQAAAIDTAPECGYGAASAQLQDGLRAALPAATWSAGLMPAAEDYIPTGQSVESWLGCENTATDYAPCEFGPEGATDVVVFGDSLANPLMTTMRAAFPEVRIRGLSLPGCPVTELPAAFPSAEAETACRAFRDGAAELIRSIRPRLVLVVQNSAWIDSLADGATAEAATREWRDASAALIDRLAPSGAQLAFVSPPPTGAAPLECVTARSTPADCVTPIPSAWTTVHDVDSALPGAAYLDTSPWFCLDGACPIFSGTTLLRLDYVHTSRQYATTMAPAFRELVDDRTAIDDSSGLSASQ